MMTICMWSNGLSVYVVFKVLTWVKFMFLDIVFAISHIKFEYGTANQPGLVCFTVKSNFRLGVCPFFLS